MQRVWDLLSDLRLAFWLLVSISATLFVGSMYCLADYQFFDSMNGVRIQDWFASRGAAAPGKSWWVVLLFACFTLFGVNLAACTIRRLALLWRVRDSYSLRTFAYLVSPSVIHVLFAVMLCGHLLTFTAIDQRRYPVGKDTVVVLPDGTRASIASVTPRFFPVGTLLENRLAGTRVRLRIAEDGKAREAVLDFMQPVRAGGYLLILDMMKKRRSRVPDAAVAEKNVRDMARDSCNKEQDYKVGQTCPQGIPPLYVVATRDPGLYLLIPGFFLIIVVMLFYFSSRSYRKKATTG
jgi:hypothetical protein